MYVFVFEDRILDWRLYQIYYGWLSRAMVLGSFHCRGVLLLWHIVGQEPAVLAVVGQEPAVLAAGAGRMGLFSSHPSYLLF